MYFSNVFVDSRAPSETFESVGVYAVAVSRVGFPNAVRRFGHVVALRVACQFLMFWRTLAFHSEPSSLLVPCDAAVVSSVGSSKQ